MAAMTEKTEAEWRRTALDAMLAVEGYSVVIVCTGTESQAAYWQKRLELGKGWVIPASCQVLCVYEDWNSSGAGNGLGTLYAWQKACALAKEMKPEAEALETQLSKGLISVAMYHTAGKGTRLAPLPGAENNNKPGVKLPACAPVGENKSPAPLTILESVVKQTGIYAASRIGRLSVYWGDQIFVPTVSASYDATKAHADILCMLGPMPSAQVWVEQGLEKYGLIACAKSGAACQIEKVDHATALKMTESLGEIEKVGTSLGSFSVSSELLECLMTEFKPELLEKTAQLDTDPDWWMPMTLPVEAYVQLMGKKGISEADATTHHARIAKMLETSTLVDTKTTKPLLGAVDVGNEAYWWDYGQLKLYLKNAFRLIEDGVEADAMREFMSVERGQLENGGAKTAATAVKLGQGYQVSGSSVLANVTVESLVATDAVVVNCTAKKLVCPKNSVAYNVVEPDELILSENEVVTDIFMPDGEKIRQKSTLSVDGKKAWKEILPSNKFSFEQIYKTNLAVDVVKSSQIGAKAHADLALTLDCTSGAVLD